MPPQTRPRKLQGRSEPANRQGPAAAPDPAWAWAPYEPSAEQPWTLRLAGHLYRRAGFGATWGQLQAALADGPQRTVDRLLRPGEDVAAFNRTYDQYEEAAVSPDSDSGAELRQWWLRRMVLTPHPLAEKMALFWHNHFAVPSGRVQNGRLMLAYVRLLRSHALGRFSALLEGICRDGATLVALDLGPNPKNRPSDHLARPLLELFTVGPGAFSPRDVQEAARAFTGWSIWRRELRYLEHQHDSGTKRVLGEEGNFSGDDVVRILLRQASTPRRLVRKLYRWLVAETDEPADALLEPLAESFAKDYDVGGLVGTILRSNLFFSPTAYRRRIKSPVEFALSLVRPLEALIPTGPLGRDLVALGQDLCAPPTIHGWEGGRAWITTATLIARANLAASMFRGTDPYGDKLDPAAIAAKHGKTGPEAAGRFLVELLVQDDLDDAVRDALLAAPPAPATADANARLRQLAHAVASLPEFHLA